jgi:hypothetical protein
MTNGLDRQWNFLSLNGLALYGVQLAGDMHRVPFNLTFSVNAGGTQATIEETVLTGFSVYHMTIIDQNGNVAEGDIAAVSTPVNIDTSGLDASSGWMLKVQLEKPNATNPELALDNGSFAYEVEVPKSAALTFNNQAGEGTPSLKIDGNTVADAGSYNAGSVSVGDVVLLDATILNTETAKNGAFQLDTVTIAGDGSFFAAGITPVLIAPEAESNAWKILMDTAGAGAKAATLTFTSSRSSNVSYSITINLTVA